MHEKEFVSADRLVRRGGGRGRAGGLSPGGPGSGAGRQDRSKHQQRRLRRREGRQSISNALAHTLAAKDAPAAWAELVEAARQPPYPAAWQLQEPSPEEQRGFDGDGGRAQGDVSFFPMMSSGRPRIEVAMLFGGVGH